MSVFEIKEHVVEASYIREYARATSHSQEEKLWLHVKEYIPKDNPYPRKGDVTIIGSHANGFPKELYEPLWEDIYHEAKSQNLRIRSILIADAAWQGQSGLINRDSLGNDPSWFDYARDMLQMIQAFRSPLPIIGVGHSFGANALTNLAFLHPRLLTSLVLLEPVISNYSSLPDRTVPGPANISMSRREVWPSRKEAAAAFSRSPFFGTWNPRVLERWIKYGVTDVPEKDEVKLTTTKHHEVFNFLRPSWDAYDDEGKKLLRPELVPDLNPSLHPRWPTYPFYRPEGPDTVARLPHLRPSVLYIFGGKSNVSPLELQEEKMTLTGSGVGGSGGQTKGRVKKVVGKDNSHLMPMEDPLFCARVATQWIKAEVDRWRVDDLRYENWTTKHAEDKTTLSEEHKKFLAMYEGGSGKKRKQPNPKI
ncbi:Alpha/beta hydrolase family-domain-containing protein [Fusarium avenaceum]|nr:Alpha/beta hydrolase family-domain-containing protein [Fusarium avenaceum]